MATGWRVVDGSWNYFMANGAWMSDYMDAKAQSYSSNTNWLILVDTSRCVTSIYTGSWNNWSLNRRYVCSTGKANTPTVIGSIKSTVRDTPLGMDILAITTRSSMVITYSIPHPTMLTAIA